VAWKDLKHSPVAGIIPARYASSRFPGKPLALIGDHPMIQRVYEQALKSLDLYSLPQMMKELKKLFLILAGM